MKLRLLERGGAGDDPESGGGRRLLACLVLGRAGQGRAAGRGGMFGRYIGKLWL